MSDFNQIAFFVIVLWGFVALLIVVLLGRALLRRLRPAPPPIPPPPTPRPVPSEAISWNVRSAFQMLGLSFVTTVGSGAFVLVLHFGAGPTASPLVLGLILIGIGAVVAIPFGFTALALLRQRWIYRTGTACLATVRKVAATGSREGSLDWKRVRKFHYEFFVGSRAYSGTWKVAKWLQIGTAIWVVYSPNDPTRNLAVPGDYPPPEGGSVRG